MPKTVILGYYGFSNTGDEALLAAISDSLRRRCPELEITVLTAGDSHLPGVTGVTAVNRWHPARVTRALRRADLLIAGGGTLLQDSTSLRSLFYYVGIILLARRLGKRVMLYANGLGPLRTGTGHRLARRALAAADVITLRDRKSLHDLNLWFPDLAHKARLTADPALLLAPAGDDQARELLAGTGVAGDQPFLAACVRPWNGVAYEAPLASALDAVAGRHGMVTLFLPMQVPRDVAASRRVMAHMHTPAYLMDRPVPPRLFMALLARSTAVAAMRLHAAVLAAALPVPALGIAYDPKIEGVLSDIGLPILGRPGEITAEKLGDALEDLIRRHDALQEALRQRVAGLRELAEENAALALSLVGK